MRTRLTKPWHLKDGWSILDYNEKLGSVRVWCNKTGFISTIRLPKLVVELMRSELARGEARVKTEIKRALGL